MTPNDDLLNFVTAVSGEAYLKVEETLGDGYVRLRVSEAERRQAKHDIRSVEDVVVELLRNSRDAHARRIFVATGREGDVRTITFVDDGIGVPVTMHERIFEPRVTSKLETMVIDQWGVHGRGMALFSIRSNSTEARIASSDLHKGVSLTVVTDANSLSEKSDQSTWPVVERGDSGGLKVARGPHNMVRGIIEFAVQHPGIEVFFGTPTEVLATLSALGRSQLDPSALLFCDNVDLLPVSQRPAAAADAEELVEIGRSLALAVSERTAHRILGGELAVLRPVLELVAGSAASTPQPAAPDIYRDRRGLKLHHTDIAQFQRDLETAFDTIAEPYYLHLKCEPKVTIGKDDIRVRFEVEKED